MPNVIIYNRVRYCPLLLRCAYNFYVDECIHSLLTSFSISSNKSFLVRDSIYAIARYMPSPVRLSICLSVTRVDQSKTVEVRITQPSPQSSLMTLISWCSTSPWNSKCGR